MPRRPRRVGVFGGTFDPIHVAHLVAAVNARHQLRLDLVLLVVANVPWQKATHRTVTPAEDRYAMVSAAVARVGGLAASRVEIDRGGETYTADTLEHFEELYPGAELFLVVGSDLLPELATWKQVDRIRSVATLAVVNRAGAPAGPMPDGWRAERVDIPALDISSRELRARAGSGLPLDFLVPAAAIRCIRERGLYARAG